MGAYEDMVVTSTWSSSRRATNIHGTQRKKVVGDVLDLTDLEPQGDGGGEQPVAWHGSGCRSHGVLLHDPKGAADGRAGVGVDPQARIEIRELQKNSNGWADDHHLEPHPAGTRGVGRKHGGDHPGGKLLFSASVD